MTTEIRDRVRTSAAVPPRPAIGATGAGTLVAAGVAGAVLGVLGLVTVLPPSGDGVPALILGGALVLAGVLFRAAAARSDIPTAPGVPAKVAGFLAEVVLGLVAVVLGVLALIRAGEPLYLAFGAIALGLGLWMGSADLEQFDRAVPRTATLDRKAVDDSAGVDVLFGILAVALGILAWIGVSPRALPLVADVGVGAALMIIGLALSRRAARA
jgi:hypothetical protein